MDNQTLILIFTAGSIAFFHTVLGPDHYVPFIVLAREKNWAIRKTLIITILCGIGHVGSSILLGLAGIALGWSLTSLKLFEGYRGAIAGWLLIAFGLVYMVWGIRRVLKNKPHSHLHTHADGSVHLHDHIHTAGHSHWHEPVRKNMTPWILFIIFVFGPCEPLIPLVMYPAARANYPALYGVIIIFSLFTILTMIAIVSSGVYGLKMIRLGFLERYANVLAGGIILVTGIAVQLFGL